MNPLIIFWSISSAIVGAGFVVAAWHLRPALKMPGSLIPFAFCLANGLYELVFSVSLLLSASRVAGSNNTDVILLWLLFYLPARLTGIALALLLSGQVSDGVVRERFKAIRNMWRRPPGAK